jgi:RHS repeat-associated protein
LALAEQQFGRELRPAPRHIVSPPEHGRIVRYLGQNVAQVADAKGHTQLAVSSIPLQTPKRHGKLAPIDLALRRTKTGFGPINSSVPVAIPDRLGTGVTVGTPGLTFNLDAPRAADTRGTLSGNNVFYPSVAADTDALISDVPTGAEVSWLLRSANSPEERALKFDLPRGATLQKASDGSVRILTDAGPIGMVGAVSAVDAQGQVVPTRMSVSDQSVVVHVAHRSGDYAYPILVDPVVENWMICDLGNPSPNTSCNWKNGWTTDFTGWTSVAPHPSRIYTGTLGGLDIVVNGGPLTAGTDLGQWIWPTYGSTTFISRAEFGYTKYAVSGTGANVLDLVGIMDAGGSFVGYGVVPPNSSGNYYVVFPGNNVSGANPQGGKKVAFAIGPWLSGTYASSFNTVGGVVFFEDDPEPPTIDSITHNLTTSTPLTGWLRGGIRDSMVVPAHDPGLGVQVADVSPTANFWNPVGVGEGAPTTDPIAYWCTGTVRDRCPSTYTFHPSYYTDDVAEGVHTLSLVLVDAAGHPTVSSWTEKVDKSGPIMPMGWINGTLVDAKDKRIPQGSYTVNATASDHWTSVASSGMGSITLKIDGSTVHAAGNPSVGTQDCNADGTGGCGGTLSTTLETENYGAGEHTITVEAKDRAGNLTSQSWKVSFARPAQASVGPGTLDLLTGNLSVSADDVSVPAFASSLTVSRTFNSRDPSANKNGVFGPGWVASLPIDEAGSDYTQLQYTGPTANGGDATGDGTVNITESDGTVDTYIPDGTAAGYTSPPWMDDLTLTRVPDPTPANVTFHLEDRDGDDTVFGMVGATASGAPIYAPVSITQASNSFSKTSVGYQVVNGVARPSEIVQGPPSPTPPTARSGPIASDSCPTAPGARALDFVYADSPTAIGAGSDPNTWGDYTGQIKEVDFKAAGSTCTHPAIARYLYDNLGRLRAESDPRTGLQTTYAYDGTGADNPGRLTSITPAGLNPWSFNYTTGSDGNPGRLATVSRQDPVNGQATTAIKYDVPVSGSGAPYPMDASTVATWRQSQAPASATAIFPPDAGASPAGYAEATIHYLDSLGREVNTASPNGGISMTQYDGSALDSQDNVTRTLTPENRLKQISSPGSANGPWETDLQYTPDGAAVADKLGPIHTVQLQNGQHVQARTHTHTSFDECPGGSSACATKKGIQSPVPGVLSNKGPFDLPTTVTEGAQIDGQADADVRTTTYSYNGADDSQRTSSGVGIGWFIRKPTLVVQDVGGQNLTSATLYDWGTGSVIESRLPANYAGGDAHATKSIVYTADNSAADSACQNHPEWATLPCEVLPAAQPGTSGLPTIPVVTYQYNAYDEPTLQTETATRPDGTVDTRTTTFAYDDAGRKISGRVETHASAGPGLGHPVPEVRTDYSSTTGQPVKTYTVDTGGAELKAITRSYDSLGRLTDYYDANGSHAQASYDIDGRPTQVSDGKGNQTMVYDPTSGVLKELDDSALTSQYGSTSAGKITASYNADGNMTTEDLPNGVELRLTYDETGQLTERKYMKGTDTWLDSTGIRSIHSQWLHVSDGLSTQNYSYDGVGRLTQTQDTPQGHGCTTRAYTFDGSPGLDSNRTSETSWPPATDGSCQGNTNGTVTPHSYDAADRLTDTGVAYDSFGRMLTVPSQDAGGAPDSSDQPLSLEYYTDDMTYSMGQPGASVQFGLDPNGRDDSINPSTGTSETDHFADDSDSPAWTENPADPLEYTRNIEGIDGDLLAIDDSQTGLQFQLTNLHGDVVSLCSPDSTATGPTKNFETDEFGVPRSSGGIAQRYGYLGSKRRPAYLASGVIQMGERAYVPEIGRFTSVDPVAGGSANAYDYADQDPVNGTDLGGTTSSTCQGEAGVPYGTANPESGQINLKWNADIYCPFKRLKNFQIHVVSVLEYQIVGISGHNFARSPSRACENGVRTCEQSGSTFTTPLGQGTCGETFDVRTRVHVSGSYHTRSGGRRRIVHVKNFTSQWETGEITFQCS